MRRSSGVSAALGGASGPSAGQGHPISSINEIRLNGRENFVLGKIIGGGRWALCTVTKISLSESPLDCKNRGKTTASRRQLSSPLRTRRTQKICAKSSIEGRTVPAPLISTEEHNLS